MSPSKKYKDLRLGTMITYAYDGKTTYGGYIKDGKLCGGSLGVVGRRADGSAMASLDECADGLDVNDLVAVARSMCAEYIEFTTWHANMNVLYPSEVIKRLLPGHCSKRDVIRDLINALKGSGIKLYLYVHPNDGHDFSKEDQDKAGWNDGPPYKRWNELMHALFEELAQRYRGEIAGYWVDGVGAPGGAMDEQGMIQLMKTVRRIDPSLEIMMNGDCGVGKWADYGSSESVRWPYAQAHNVRITQTVSLMYYADGGYAWFSPELAFQYTILQAAVEDATGGVAWATGPYPGGKWEYGVREFFGKLGDYIKPVAATILGTKPSKSFVTPDKTFLIGDSNRWMLWVATESTDAQKTYIHVLRGPPEKTLHLPVPADGRKFSRATLFKTGSPVALVQDSSGVHLTLAPSDAWGLLDTVITLG